MQGDAGEAGGAPAASRRWQATNANVVRRAMKANVNRIWVSEQKDIHESLRSAVEIFRDLHLENVPVSAAPEMPKDLFSVVGDSMVFGDGNIGLGLVEVATPA